MSPIHFHYSLTSPQHNQYGFILLGDEKVHHIEDVNKFYQALGYTDEILKSGLLPEEFVWYEYHKDDSEKSEICLQAKIIKYLINHSATFKEKYAAQCEYWLAKCMEKWKSKSAECKDCDEPKTKIKFSHA